MIQITASINNSHKHFKGVEITTRKLRLGLSICIVMIANLFQDYSNINKL